MGISTQCADLEVRMRLRRDEDLRSRHCRRCEYEERNEQSLRAEGHNCPVLVMSHRVEHGCRRAYVVRSHSLDGSAINPHLVTASSPGLWSTDPRVWTLG
jgi:hypothetical protein